MDTSCDGLPGLVAAAPEDDGPAGGAAPVAGEMSAEDVARSATPTDGDTGKKTAKAAPKAAKKTPAASEAEAESEPAASPAGKKVGKPKANAGTKGGKTVAKKGVIKKPAGVKVRPAAAVESKQAAAAAASSDPGNTGTNTAVVQTTNGGEAVEGKGGGKQGGNVQLAQPQPVYRDVMKSRRFMSLWRAKSLPEEAQTLVDEMEVQRQKGAWQSTDRVATFKNVDGVWGVSPMLFCDVGSLEAPPPPLPRHSTQPLLKPKPKSPTTFVFSLGALDATF